MYPATHVQNFFLVVFSVVLSDFSSRFVLFCLDPRVSVMLRRSQTLNYFLAFNAKCKARPNFGLRGVGQYTSETYNKRGQTLWLIPIMSIPPLTIFLVNTKGVFKMLDEIGGGGPHNLEPHEYGVPSDRKPWEFKFAIGEGFAAGPAKLRPAPGVPALEHH